MANTSNFRNPAIDAKPIIKIDQPIYRGPGQPRKYPAMPVLPWSEEERFLFDDWMKDFLDAFPDLTRADYRLLWLSGVKYIQFLRLTFAEVETGTLISMARQHPAVEMRSLLEQLSVTRRARTKGARPEDDEVADIRKQLLAIGQS